MRTVLLQTDISRLDPAANMRTAEALMATAPGADLYVLPEMWSTGFCTAPDAGLPPAAPALEWMQRQAAERDCAVAGSLAVRPAPGARLRNRFFFVRPDGSSDYYDKRHLFAFGGEDTAFEAGTRRVTTEWRGVRFLLQVCFDLRFPESARLQPDSPYDAVLYAASWPASRRAAWDALLPARAIENQAYVIGVNRTGGAYNGGTAAYNPQGRCIGRCSAEAEALEVTVDAEEAAQWRKAFPMGTRPADAAQSVLSPHK